MKKISSQKQNALKLARQAQGTITKIISMIEKDNYCPDIIQQVSSVYGFLKSIKRELLNGHLNFCVEKRIKENKKEAIKELLKIFNLSES